MIREKISRLKKLSIKVKRGSGMREVFKVMFPFQGINSFPKKKKKEILEILKEIHGINLYSWG